MASKSLSGNFAFLGRIPNSGLLLHLASLATTLGIGDLGPPAFSLVDRLHDASQSWWKALPLGPTCYGDSPYQSLSSFARNSLLISPYCHLSDGLLQASDCEADFDADRVGYGSIIPFKQRLLQRAWTNFKAGDRQDLRTAFEELCSEQANWLKNYAQLRALNTEHQGGDRVGSTQPIRPWPSPGKTWQIKSIRFDLHNSHYFARQRNFRSTPARRA